MCIRCLLVGHKVESCRSPYLCPVCKEPHSSMVCTEFEKKHHSQSNLVTTMVKHQSNNQLLYQTIILNINHQPVRILLDSGCGRSVITEKMVKKLNLFMNGSKKVNINFPIALQTLNSDRSKKGLIQSSDGLYRMNVTFNVVQELQGLVLLALTNTIKFKILVFH